MGLKEPKKVKEYLRKVPGLASTVSDFVPPADNRRITVINDTSGNIERMLAFTGDRFDAEEITAQSNRILTTLRSRYTFESRFVRFVLATDDGPAPVRKKETHEVRCKNDVDTTLTDVLLKSAKQGTTITRESVETIIPAIAKKKDPTQQRSGWAQFSESRAFRHYARPLVLDDIMKNIQGETAFYSYFRGKLHNALDTVEVDPCVGEADVKFGHILCNDTFADDHLIIDSADSDLIVVVLLVASSPAYRDTGRSIFWNDGTTFYNLTLMMQKWPNAIALAIAFSQAGTDYILNSSMQNGHDAYDATYTLASSIDCIRREDLARITSNALKKRPHASQAPLNKTTDDLWWNLNYWRICKVPTEEQLQHTLNDNYIASTRRMLPMRPDSETKDDPQEARQVAHPELH
jgi:hypothetical protein